MGLLTSILVATVLGQGPTPTTPTPTPLHPDLLPILQLESSGGRDVNHKPNPKGEYETAFGPLGLKPSTGWEEYRKSKVAVNNVNNVNNVNSIESFTKLLKSDGNFYNLIANLHFTRLKYRHGSNINASHAWRYGSTATKTLQDTDPAAILNTGYVKKYIALIALAEKYNLGKGIKAP